MIGGVSPSSSHPAAAKVVTARLCPAERREELTKHELTSEPRQPHFPGNSHDQLDGRWILGDGRWMWTAGGGQHVVDGERWEVGDGQSVEGGGSSLREKCLTTPSRFPLSHKTRKHRLQLSTLDNHPSGITIQLA